MSQYQGALDAADIAVVFYSPDAVAIKKLAPISKEQILSAFNRKDLIVYTLPAQFKDFLQQQNFNDTALLLMSSGNYGGLDFDTVEELLK